MPRCLFSALRVGLVVIAVLAACGGAPDSGKTPTGARASCSGDSDCVMTNQTGCCQACPQAPVAIPTLTFEQQKNRCAAASCAPSSDRIECPKVDAILDYVAKCDRGTCAAVKGGKAGEAGKK
jgi:hypothetical protein